MIKVFEDFDITLVGHYQSVLESNEIATFLKNQFGTSGAGELPFLEVVPQLWVLHDGDEAQAKSLIKEIQDSPAGMHSEAWDCSHCGEPQEPAFTHCWKCSTPRHQPGHQPPGP